MKRALQVTLRLLQVLLVVLGVAAFLGAVGALALVNTHVAHQVGKVPASWARIPTEWILTMYGVNGAQIVQSQGTGAYAALLGSIAGAWLAMVGIFLSFGPTIAAAALLIAWRLGRGVQVYRVRTEGKEDLELMGKYIKKVDKAVIYSGDFSWLNPLDEHGRQKSDGQSIRDQLQKLNRNKLVLVSDKDQATVAAEMGTAFAHYEPHLAYDNRKGLRCSFVRFGAGSYVVLNLIRTPIPGGAEVETTVSVLTGDAETMGVLRTLELCLDWPVPQEGASATAYRLPEMAKPGESGGEHVAQS